MGESMSLFMMGRTFFQIYEMSWIYSNYIKHHAEIQLSFVYTYFMYDSVVRHADYGNCFLTTKPIFGSIEYCHENQNAMKTYFVSMNL